MRQKRRPLIAVSGVDGSGKSTLVTALVQRLQQHGVQAEVVWLRPGMGLGALDGLARRIKRLLGQSAAPAMRSAATGERPPSRQGVIGDVWCLLVTGVYVFRLRSRLRRARGSVLLCDRYLLDAVVTLRVFYEGVHTFLPIRLVRLALPTPDVAIYLDVPATTAVARKPGDTIGQAAVEAQLAAYAHEANTAPQLHVLDGTSASAAQEAYELVEPVIADLGRTA